MARAYTMRQTGAVAAHAARDITRWLKAKPETRQVRNVEADPDYQRRDIDLIWKTKNGTTTIEVKGDRYDQTGNFFLETISNREAGTPGCFLYTEADFIYYYFVGPQRLFILPLPATRDWFLAHLREFREVTTTTPYRGGFYTTVGRLVKIERVLGAVSGAQCVELREALKAPGWLSPSLASWLAKIQFWKRPAGRRSADY